MLELGRVSVDEHRKIGTKAAKVADILITVGVRARDIAMAALDNGMPDNILQYEDA
jgi:UDP-N-acetylmuramoyl-tripeptide--D-alanyl-D-alanine ligase